jgi:hypothetical protein
MQCHATPAAGVPRFDFGGRVYDSNGNAAPGRAVRVKAAQGSIISVLSNNDGYFWWPPPPTGGYGGGQISNLPPARFPATAEVMHPDATKSTMCAAAPNGACNSNSCHGSTTPKVF